MGSLFEIGPSIRVFSRLAPLIATFLVQLVPTMAIFQEDDCESEEVSTNTDPMRSEKSSSSSDEPFTHSETQAVKRSKLVVYLAIAVAAATAGTATYILTNNNETATFQRQVSSHSHSTRDL